MFDISHLSPQRRAAIKLITLLASIILASGATILALELFGASNVMIGLGVAGMIYFVHMFYKIQVSIEESRDNLNKRS